MDRPPLLIVGMQGLGDCINQRPIVRATCEKLDEVYLATPWPQLYTDLRVKCCRWGSQLRLQARNEHAVPASMWHDPPPHTGAVMRLWYRPEGGNVHQQFDMLMPVATDQTWVYDLPKFRRPPQAPTRPYAVVRPVTLRGEFQYEARNPDPQYIDLAAKTLRARGLAVVSLAALMHSEESLVGSAPEADVELLNGELSTDEALGLIQGARVCVGGEGFILPAAMASRVPLVAIYSAHGHPERWVPHRPTDVRVASLVPNRLCACTDYGHVADNSFDHFDADFDRALKGLGL